MPRVCTICAHSEREAIDAAIVAGTVNREIACKFGVGRMAIERHISSKHIAELVKQSQEAKEEAQAINVVKQLKDINDVTLAIMRESRVDKKNGMALFAIDRLQKQLELQAKLLGEIDDRPQINIWLTLEWRSIRTVLIQALRPYPDARIAVASALASMEVDRDSLY